eukprot:TRINITY_DN9353_c0_g1_i1.p1 TRINITY_DN9353_c0_g1~~TRINITY_DN9353_c0_g1_i1.p1  ORF type:complete len:121 (-),score=17.67 TRINITY_DN9353_c0_g1_i1:20-382(-)
MKLSVQHRDKDLDSFTPFESFMLLKGKLFYNGDLQGLLPRMLDCGEKLMQQYSDMQKVKATQMFELQLADLGSYKERAFEVLAQESENDKWSQDLRDAIKSVLSVKEDSEDEPSEPTPQR